ncbi:MAG: type III-B CRISPR-associated protein Cas10/Cmr2 [Planctomycetes bacterium]|nr:type III-B CRISPR-associated protein Cas10/Cmr2 [Planctomycetota bacterium]
MKPELAQLKIRAFLHDPPEKAGILFSRTSGGHEGVSAELQAACGLGGDPREGLVKYADWIASGCDRIDVGPGRDSAASFLRSPVLTHPLAAVQYELPPIAEDWQSISARVLEAVRAEKDTYPGDPERIFLALWRNLPARLEADAPARLGRLWRLLPADTRVPDHSIWEHNRLVAALATALPRPALLVFAIGPVQGFIAQARKCGDLWGGSRLLSHLAWSAIETVVEEFGPDSVIYPDLAGQPSCDAWLARKKVQVCDPRLPEMLRVPTLPNRFLAVVPFEGAPEIARRASGAAREALARAVNAALGKLAIDPGTLSVSSRVARQVADILETSHVIRPLLAETPGDLGENGWRAALQEAYKAAIRDCREAGIDEPAGGVGAFLQGHPGEGWYEPNVGLAYGPLHALLDRAMGSVKATRLFEASEEPGRPCTVCGEREPISLEDPGGDARPFWLERYARDPARVRKNEQLCAICLAKRLLPRTFAEVVAGGHESNVPIRFPSTSTLAIASWLGVVLGAAKENEELRESIVEFTSVVRELLGEERDKQDWIPNRLQDALLKIGKPEWATDLAYLDGDFFFPETYEPARFEKEQGRKIDERQAENARNYLRQFLRLAAGTTIPELGVKLGRPPRYLALVQADGDGMGKWLSGELSPRVRDGLHTSVRQGLERLGRSEFLECLRPLSPAYQAALSGAIAGFGLEIVPELVETHHMGQLVYCGGDDLLAFVVLEDLVRLLANLRIAFRGHGEFRDCPGFEAKSGYVRQIHGDRTERLWRVPGPEASISAGVAIFHHRAPLSTVRRVLVDLEKIAKSVKGKNALCIGLLKRSGEESAVLFQPDKEVEKPLDLLADLTGAFRGAKGLPHLSPRLLGDYARFGQTLGAHEDLEEAYKSELLASFRRHKIDEKSPDPGELVERLLAARDQLARPTRETPWGKLGTPEVDRYWHPAAHVQRFLSLASFLARGDER